MIQGQNDRIRIPDSATESVSRDAEIAELQANAEKWREHSITLNKIGWRISEALGNVSEGADSVEGDPVADLETLISASSSLVATREAIARAAYGAMYPDAADTYGDPELREERNLAHRIADAVLGVVREVGDVEAEQREKDAVIAELRAQEQLWARQAERARMALGGYILQEMQDGGTVPAEILEADDALSAAPFHSSATAAAIRGGEKND